MVSYGGVRACLEVEERSRHLLHRRVSVRGTCVARPC